jgi:hypothetical protein
MQVELWSSVTVDFSGMAVATPSAFSVGESLLSEIADRSSGCIPPGQRVQMDIEWTVGGAGEH